VLLHKSLQVKGAKNKQQFSAGHYRGEKRYAKNKKRKALLAFLFSHFS
jgi:hypothetical protein